jgi:hypothetical protein
MLRLERDFAERSFVARMALNHPGSFHCCPFVVLQDACTESSQENRLAQNALTEPSQVRLSCSAPPVREAGPGAALSESRREPTSRGVASVKTACSRPCDQDVATGSPLAVCIRCFENDAEPGPARRRCNGRPDPFASLPCCPFPLVSACGCIPGLSARPDRMAFETTSAEKEKDHGT